MGKTGRKNKVYSAEFKIGVIMDMREHHLSYHETVRKYELGNDQTGGARLMLQRWERIYLEEVAEGLMKERRGRACSAGGTKTSFDYFVIKLLRIYVPVSRIIVGGSAPVKGLAAVNLFVADAHLITTQILLKNYIMPNR